MDKDAKIRRALALRLLEGARECERLGQLELAALDRATARKLIDDADAFEGRAARSQIDRFPRNMLRSNKLRNS